MPTEEVFTTPDSRRTEGVVRSTRPLPLGGSLVRGLELRFEDGRIVDVQAETGADVLRGELATDERAPYLGEVALVDGKSRVGQTGLIYFDGLFDENAACHIAYGSCYTECLEGHQPVPTAPNESARAHRPDDRRAGGRRRRHHPRRHGRAAAAKRRLATRSVKVASLVRA